LNSPFSKHAEAEYHRRLPNDTSNEPPPDCAVSTRELYEDRAAVEEEAAAGADARERDDGAMEGTRSALSTPFFAALLLACSCSDP